MADEPIYDVPVETYEDHIILRPPNRLKARVTLQADPRSRHVDPVRRAEHALHLLGEEFDHWIDAELLVLEKRRVTAQSSRSAADFDALYRAAHDIRGQAATLGFPLVGEVADGLCTMIETVGPDATPQAVIDRHVETMRAMVRENVRERDHPLGVALVRRLAELRGDVAPATAQ